MKRTNLRIGCLLLVLVLLLGVLPATALADEVEGLIPPVSLETLEVYASYDGVVNETPIYTGYVESDTPINAYLQSLPLSLEKAGYTHDEWYLYYHSEIKVLDTDKVTGSTKVLVKYTSVNDPTITVTFVSANGMPPVVQEVTGGCVQKPDDPTMEGYNFLGWFTEMGGGVPFDFDRPVTESVIVYAHWERETPVAVYYLSDNFPAWLEVGTYQDVALSVLGSWGSGWQYDTYITVSVKGPAWSDAKLLYYTGNGWDWWWNGYVDAVDAGQIPDTFDFNETGVTIPLSLYLDRAGTYEFTFTLYTSDGKTVLATDTATVKATEPAHDDYSISTAASMVPSPPGLPPGRTTRILSPSMSIPTRAMSWIP